MVNVMARTWAISCLLAPVAVFGAGCGGNKAAEPLPSPLVASGGVTAGGAGVLGSSPTTLTADYTPNRNLGLAFVIQNRSDKPVTIVGVVSKDESEKRFASLIGEAQRHTTRSTATVTHVLRLILASARRPMDHCRL
jgi:hypothetical protein